MPLLWIGNTLASLSLSGNSPLVILLFMSADMLNDSMLATDFIILGPIPSNPIDSNRVPIQRVCQVFEFLVNYKLIRDWILISGTFHSLYPCTIHPLVSKYRKFVRVGKWTLFLWEKSKKSILRTSWRKHILRHLPVPISIQPQE